jgi:hypothetical protein
MRRRLRSVLRRHILMPGLDCPDFPVEISNAPGGGWDPLGPVIWREIYEKGHLAV